MTHKKERERDTSAPFWEVFRAIHLTKKRCDDVRMLKGHVFFVNLQNQISDPPYFSPNGYVLGFSFFNVTAISSTDSVGAIYNYWLTPIVSCSTFSTITAGSVPLDAPRCDLCLQQFGHSGLTQIALKRLISSTDWCWLCADWWVVSQKTWNCQFPHIIVEKGILQINNLGLEATNLGHQKTPTWLQQSNLRNEATLRD